MLSEKLRSAGVVGAGGAGFPTHVKAGSKVEFVVANGAECEPLIHKDYELMKEHPAEVVAGLLAMLDATGARLGKFGIKSKNHEAMEAIRAHAPASRVEMVALGDFYPSGDEYELVYAATGRLIPPAGIPLQVGCVVSNVETLFNVGRAVKGQPVTEKLVSICGAVREPKTVWAPLGTSFEELLQSAGGAIPNDYAVFPNGLMMGQFSFSLDDVVTKTTSGLIILPRDHYLVTRKDRTKQERDNIGKSACDQCSYCTELCPRYLLGYDVMPHKVMRSLGFTENGAEHWSQWSELCCACGLCTLYSCPEDLYPKEACDGGKATRRAAGMKFTQQRPLEVHPMKEYRRVPQSQLRQRLKVEEYNVECPLDPAPLRPKRVSLKLRQHTGKAADAVVAVGAKVKKGQVIGRVEASALGADIHASIDGTVKFVSSEFVKIEA